MAEAKKPKAAKKAASKKTVARKQASPATAAEPQVVTIDGRDYDMARLSDHAKAQLNNLRAVDKRQNELELELSIVRTARVSYAAALEAELKKTDKSLQ